MALMQIAEPGQSSKPHEVKLAAGIDLGTTNSLVASVRSGKASTLVDTTGQAILPSVVNYQKQAVLVGKEAHSLSEQDPANTIHSVKRLLGRSAEEVRQLNTMLPYQLVDTDSMPKIRTTVGDLSPVQVSADILSVLKGRAEKTLGGELSGVVITVPAYFDDAQRQATKDAAKIAQLPVLRLINEPTAAAMAYGLDQGAEGVHVVYDLGGGTFDVSVLRLSKGVLEVLSTGGDSALGGDDFDQLIAQWFCAELNIDEPAAQLKRQVLNQARKAKEQLSNEPSACMQVSISGKRYQADITEEILGQLAQPLVERTLKVLRRAMRDAKVKLVDIDEVVLVGGATRMPVIKEAVYHLFNKDALSSIDPDQVVAIGAALQADRLIGNNSSDDMVLLDVVPLSLGVETMGDLSEKIIKRNTPIPITRAQEFTTFKDGQNAMSIHVVQGEREQASANRSLARFAFKGIPAMAAGTARIRVTFTVDADGLLQVSAKEMSSNTESHIEVKPSYGLAPDEVTAMLRESVAHAQEDMQARQLIEQRIEAEQILLMLRDALRADGQLITEAERKQIDKQMHLLNALTQGDEVEPIKLAIAELNKVSENFANLRMNKSIKAALVGKTVDKGDKNG